MLVYRRHVEPLGFKPSAMFSDIKCCSHYYKKLPGACAVMVVSNDTGDVIQLIQVFRLTLDQYRKFDKGKLKLIPHGCCNPTGGEDLEGPDIMFRGQFKSGKQVRELVTACENILHAEGRPACH